MITKLGTFREDPIKYDNTDRKWYYIDAVRPMVVQPHKDDIVILWEAVVVPEVGETVETLEQAELLPVLSVVLKNNRAYTNVPRAGVNGNRWLRVSDSQFADPFVIPVQEGFIVGGKRIY